MAKENLNRAPYNDDYDPSKGYKQIVALPGRVEQAREFTQLQSMFLDFIKRIGDTILKNGSVIEGCELVVSGEQAIIGRGKVYIDGIVHDTPETTITISGVGNEVIGVFVDETIVTETSDPSLRDPAQGFDNFNQPGAHRVKAAVRFVVNDASATPIYTLNNGALLIQEEKPQLDIVSDLLARRTNDESGNYRVSGFTLGARKVPNPPYVYGGVAYEQYGGEEIEITVESGKAYISGYEVVKPTGVRMVIDNESGYRSVIGEPKVFSPSKLIETLNNKYCDNINRILVTQATTEEITRGSVPGGIDPLSNNEVAAIISVTAAGVTYVNGTDYQLTGGGIDWSLGGSEPATGSSYNVSYHFITEASHGLDFRYRLQEDGTSIIEWLTGMYVDHPVTGTQYYVDYEYRLARKDLISLNRQGEIVVTRGQSDIPERVSTPSNANPALLNLGSVYVPPRVTASGDYQLGTGDRYGTPIATSHAITRLSMEQLQSIVRRVEDMEYNSAMSALDEEAMAGEQASNLRGIFSDGFIGLTKSDISNALYTVSMDIENGEIMHGTSSATVRNLTIGQYGAYVGEIGRVATAPFREVVKVSQPFATGTMLVNPYNVFNRLGVVKLNPSIDSWIDLEKVVVENNETSALTLNRWWVPGGDNWTAEETDLYNNIILESGSWSNNGMKVGTVTTKSSKTILDESVQYMRQIDVTVTASNFLPNSDNIKCTFDGIHVPLTPVAPTQQGSSQDTVRANASGSFTAKFRIPANVRCGTREVVLSNESNTAVTSYTANGRKRVIEDTVLKTRVTVTPYDPLAQSFQFEQDQMLTAVDLYFASKDNNSNVTVQIRNMVNGYPGQVVHAETVLSPSDIQFQANQLRATNVKFEDPVLCRFGEQYCVVVITDSDKYSMYIGELGKRDLFSSANVTRQPYLAGTLFSSANAVTWTAHQTADLTFKVYVAEFSTEYGVVWFNRLTSADLDRLMFAADFLTPEGTSLEWTVVINNGSPIPIQAYREMKTSSIANTVELRVQFRAKPNVSPMLALDSVGILGFKTRTNSSYIGRNVVFDGTTYTTVKQTIEAHLPSGSTVNVRYSHDNGVTWITSTLDSAETVDNNTGYVRMTYSHTGTTPRSNFRARIDITSTNRLQEPRIRKFTNVMK